MGQRLYKVVAEKLWREAEAAGDFAGAEIDHDDGFIHLSSASQVVETVTRHFAGQADLLLVSVDEEALGETLKWERSRGGDLFPHVYGVIQMNAVVDVVPLPLGADGAHIFPADLN